MNSKRYRRRVKPVTAERFVGILRGPDEGYETFSCLIDPESPHRAILIDSHSPNLPVSGAPRLYAGDWVVTTGEGRVTIWDDESFRKTFEPVEDTDGGNPETATSR